MQPKFIKSAKNIYTDLIYDDEIEICFMGRSNVGKSTVINSIANFSIAKSSKTPGRTQLINLFDFGKYRLVDLPGYGYAKISKEQQMQISNMISDYISARKNLYCVFQVCDIRNIMPIDKEMNQVIRSRFANYYVILNKVDKLNKSYFDNNKFKIAKALGVDVDKLIPYSAMAKTNISRLYQAINTAIKDVL